MDDVDKRLNSTRGRTVALGAVVTALVVPYLAWLTTGGAGFIVGDEAFWLLQGRDAFDRLPAVAGSLVPLTDVISGAWAALTSSLGLFGARLGWVLVNAGAALLVFGALARNFPPGRVAVAVVAAAPMICSQQFMVLEYTNVPWSLMLLFALSFVQGQRSDLPAGTAGAWGAAAGVFLGAAILSRLLLLPALVLPVAAWLLAAGMGRRGSMVACCSAAMLTLAGGALWLWRAGALADTMAAFQATRNLGADAASNAGDFYSTWRLLSVYVQNTVVGLEQFALAALWLVVFLLFTCALGGWSPRGKNFLTVASLMFAAAAAILAPIAAPGVFNHRFQSGFPFLVVVFCGLQLWRYCRVPASSRGVEVRQLLLLGVTIPIAVMAGSNLGFYRMISGSWLAVPLAIVVIPEAAAAIGTVIGRCAPGFACDATTAARRFLHAVATVMLLYAISNRLALGFASDPPAQLTAALRHPLLKHIRETPSAAKAYDDMLEALQKRVAPRDVVLAYPHLEMVYWLTDTASPLRFMFAHSSETAIREALERSKPRCIVAHDNSTNALWQHSDSLRAVVAEFLAADRYRATWTNGRFTIHERPE